MKTNRDNNYIIKKNKRGICRENCKKNLNVIRFCGTYTHFVLKTGMVFVFAIILLVVIRF